MDREYTENYWNNHDNWEKIRRSYFPSDMNDKAHKRSRWFADCLSEFEFGSVLEVGSNCGRNLYHIKNKYPDVKVAGIDVNENAVEFARNKVDGDFFCCSACDIADEVKSKKYDIVFTMAVLIHIPPRDIEGVIDSMISLADKAVIHIEYNSSGELLSGPAGAGPTWRVSAQYLWGHDLISVYNNRGVDVEVRPIPDECMAVGIKEMLICKIRD